MIYKYINSQGKEFPFYSMNVKVSEGNLRVHKWKAITTDLVNGSIVAGFSKEPVTLPLTLTVRGSIEERKDYADSFVSAKEYDIRSKKPGRLYAGDYYAECYILEADTHVSEKGIFRTDIDVSVFIPSGFWRRVQELPPFFPVEDADAEWLDYKYGYPYGYYNRKNTYVYNNNSDFESKFIMVIQGPATNPSISIGGHIYKVNDTIFGNERIEINSEKKTIYKFGEEITNIIGKRYKDQSIFDPIKSGENTISWDGTFGFTITLFDDRSEPPWRSTNGSMDSQ